MRIAVVGLGKMGLPLAVRLAEGGADVIGVDINPSVVESVNAGLSHVGEEPELDTRLAAVHGAGRLRASIDTVASVGACDAVLVLVRLMTDDDDRPDYAMMDAATAAIARGLHAGTTVIYETTLPVGDTRGRFAPMLETISGLRAGVDFHVCFSPERVQAGRVFRNLDGWPKLVGGLTEQCVEAGTAVYRDHLSAEVWPLTSLEAAEFTKIAENVYRDVNIALANELARYADEANVDFAEVIRAANSQPLSALHRPGIGVGGHCIPVYPHFLIRRASDARITSLARQVNDSMPAHAADRLESMMGGLEARRVLVLGLSFRGGVREAGHSMALPLVSALRSRGAEVRVHDPLFGVDGVSQLGLDWGDAAGTWPEALVLQSDHAQYRGLAPTDLPSVQCLFDGRDFLDAQRWTCAGVRVSAFGRDSAQRTAGERPAVHPLARVVDIRAAS